MTNTKLLAGALLSIASLTLPACQTRYLTTDEKVYRVPSGSTILKPNGQVILTPWDGYLLSDGRLVELYEAAKGNVEADKLAPME